MTTQRETWITWYRNGAGSYTGRVGGYTDGDTYEIRRSDLDRPSSNVFWKLTRNGVVIGNPCDTLREAKARAERHETEIANTAETPAEKARKLVADDITAHGCDGSCGYDGDGDGDGHISDVQPDGVGGFLVNLGCGYAAHVYAGQWSAEAAPAEQATRKPVQMTPHDYERIGVAHFRTCRVCGLGANASIHRATAEPVPALTPTEPTPAETPDPQAIEAARLMGERDGKYGLGNYFDTYVVAGVSEGLRAAYGAAYEAASTPIEPTPSEDERASAELPTSLYEVLTLPDDEYDDYVETHQPRTTTYVAEFTKAAHADEFAKRITSDDFRCTNVEHRAGRRKVTFDGPDTRQYRMDIAETVGYYGSPPMGPVATLDGVATPRSY